jgi:GntR family transcriptional regulator
MQFRETQPIYLQIAEFVCEKIILKEWVEQDRIPSVRELAITLEVNPNTVMRTYEFLQQEQIISNERGIGFFVSDKGVKNALAFLRSEFTDKHAPHLFKQLMLLDMDLKELQPYFEKYIRKNFPKIYKSRYENQ